jgi:hypothetical protein
MNIQIQNQVDYVKMPSKDLEKTKTFFVRYLSWILLLQLWHKYTLFF